jgi:hypothetical protein
MRHLPFLKSNNLPTKNSIFFTLILLVSLLSSSYVKAAGSSEFSLDNLALYDLSASLETRLYETIKLDEYGLNRDALIYAVQGYEKLVAEGMVSNARYLTVIDFSQPIFNKRFYLLDVENMELVVNTFVMHGKNSGDEMADNFSNKINSNQSSLGFYVTKNPYYGSRGYSLRLEGLEPEFNSNAAARGVVLHGSDYINEERALNRNIERSLGCPAIPQAWNPDVINCLKEGSVMFIYFPSEEYLEHSEILKQQI